MTNPPKAKHTFDIDMLQVDYCKKKNLNLIQLWNIIFENVW